MDEDSYFSYYAQFAHQSNMLADSVRTSTYHAAITGNSAMFKDKIVMDLGAGSGILSYFAIQAGAKRVYAVEASKMANNISKLVERTPAFKGKIIVINKKIEDMDSSQEKVDIIVSEPMGVLLVHERMIESFIVSRDKYLKPEGVLFPNAGIIYLAPVSDGVLWTQTQAKARFWNNKDFFGVDFSVLERDARDEYFAMPVVGGFDPKSIMADTSAHFVDFHTITLDKLKEFSIPIKWRINFTGLIHCIGGWFDVSFIPPSPTANNTYQLSTHPGLERTHWHQIRFLLREPLAVNFGQEVTGTMHFKVNNARSYTISCELSMQGISRNDHWQLQDQTYIYSYDASTNPTEFFPEFVGLHVPDAPVDSNQVMEM
jgi:histone-arginine methyltransferase CARM1